MNQRVLDHCMVCTEVVVVASIYTPGQTSFLFIIRDDFHNNLPVRRELIVLSISTILTINRGDLVLSSWLFKLFSVP